MIINQKVSTESQLISYYCLHPLINSVKYGGDSTLKISIARFMANSPGSSSTGLVQF